VIEQLLQADRLLSVDQVDQAEALYRRVFQNDPLDAIAVVGLARCALARGDDRRAHELAAQALGIDPENDMARRMEARLAEILAVRGEPAPRPATAALPPTREMRPAVTGDAPPAAVTRAPAAPPAPSRSFLDRLLGRA
jgi:thioredoxin-like negative regulator of GroEL